MTRIGGIALGAAMAASLAVALFVAPSFLPDTPASGVMAPVASVEDQAEIAPAEPSVEPETSEATPEAPEFDVVRIDGDGKAVVAGRAAPDEEVTLRLDGETVSVARADASGNFVSFFDVPGSDSPSILSLEVANGSGDVRRAPGQVIVTPAPAPSAAPAADVAKAEVESGSEIDLAVGSSDLAIRGSTESEPIEPEGQAEIAAAAPRLFSTGPDGLRVLPGGAQLPKEPAGLGIDAITYDASGAVQLAGRASEKANLRLYLD
ncbi:MAG: hypothetical protein AAF264_11150, partial [Pseudomonadota bacterium]